MNKQQAVKTARKYISYFELTAEDIFMSKDIRDFCKKKDINIYELIP